MAQNIPNYELYGELLAGRAPEPIHIESIKERSAKHNWTIRIHSHRRLAQIFLFRSPGVSLTIGAVEYLTVHPTILVAPPEVSHSFRFPEDVDGDVVSIRLDEIPRGLCDRFDDFNSPTETIFSKPDTPHFDDIVNLYAQLGKAFHGLNSQRLEVVTVLVELIMLYIAETRTRKVPSLSTETSDSSDKLGSQVHGFCSLLEESFHKPLAVSDYATQLGLSAPHLTRICRKAFDASPNSLVRQRRILEAKRLLQFTSLPLYEIAHRSGFRETAFFSRTFKSLVGVSPSVYRAELD